MGAAASSEAALKRTLVAALGPVSAGGTGRLPQNPRLWTVLQVGVWLKEIEMASLARTMADREIDGTMLLDDCSEEDIAALVPFPPLRRKLTRRIESLRQLAIPAADMTEVSQDIQRSLDELNNTMRTLAESIALESATASGNPSLPTLQARGRNRGTEGQDEGKKGRPWPQKEAAATATAEATTVEEEATAAAAAAERKKEEDAGAATSSPGGEGNDTNAAEVLSVAAAGPAADVHAGTEDDVKKQKAATSIQRRARGIAARKDFATKRYAAGAVDPKTQQVVTEAAQLEDTTFGDDDGKPPTPLLPGSDAPHVPALAQGGELDNELTS